MNKLDPTGESLESILASIRRSLAEQSTDVLADDGAAPPVTPDMLGAVVPGEDGPPRFLGGGKGGPGHATPEAPHRADSAPPAELPIPAERPAVSDQAFAGLDNPPPPASISATFARAPEPPPPAAPAAAAAPAEEAPKDPLWFLGRGKDRGNGVPAPTPSGAPQQQAVAVKPPPAQPTASQPPAPAAAPRPAMKEMVRGPLPPFFGSSPEAAKVEVAPAPPLPGALPAGPGVIPPAAAAPAPAAAPSIPDPPQVVVPDTAARVPAVSAAAPAAPIGGAIREGLVNGKAHSIPAPAAAQSAPRLPAGPPAAQPSAAGPSQLQGLEAMVADLLRPMLRQWLDENMPRLVSAALKAETDNAARRDPKKP